MSQSGWSPRGLVRGKPQRDKSALLSRGMYWHAAGQQSCVYIVGVIVSSKWNRKKNTNINITLVINILLFDINLDRFSLKLLFIAVCWIHSVKNIVCCVSGTDGWKTDETFVLFFLPDDIPLLCFSSQTLNKVPSLWWDRFLHGRLNKITDYKPKLRLRTIKTVNGGLKEEKVKQVQIM